MTPALPRSPTAAPAVRVGRRCWGWRHGVLGEDRLL